MKDSSEKLVRFYETGDEKYFVEFYNDTYHLVLRTAFYITRNIADAEDVCQQVYIEIYKNCDKCQAVEDKNFIMVRSWVLSIVINQSKMFVRSKDKRKKRENKSIKMERPNLKSHGSENKEVLLKIKNGINCLPEKYRLPLLLKYLDGLESTEISYMLSLNKSTLQTRINRGLKKLSSILAPYFKEEEIGKVLSLIPLCGIYFASNEVPSPIFLKSINESSKLKITSVPKIKASRRPLFCLSTSTKGFLIVTVVLILGFIDFKIFSNAQRKNNMPVENLEKISFQYDFSKGDLNGFKILQGKWDYIDGGRVAGDKVYSILALPVIPKKAFELKFEDMVNRKPTNRHSLTFHNSGVYQSDNKLVFPEDIYLIEYNFNGRIFQPKKDSVVKTPLNTTIVFFDNYVMVKYEGKVTSISQVKENYTSLSPAIIQKSICTKKIELNILDKKALKEYRDLKNNLLKKKTH